MIRVANARNNTISQATARLWLVRLEYTAEGDQLRRFHELKLERSEHPMFALSWTLLHNIDENSALFGVTTEELDKTDAALVLNVSGVDDSSAQHLYARQALLPHRYPLAASLPRHHQHFAARPAVDRLQQVSRRHRRGRVINPPCAPPDAWRGRPNCSAP